MYKVTKGRPPVGHTNEQSDGYPPPLPPRPVSPQIVSAYPRAPVSFLCCPAVLSCAVLPLSERKRNANGKEAQRNGRPKAEGKGNEGNGTKEGTERTAKEGTEHGNAQEPTANGRTQTGNQGEKKGTAFLHSFLPFPAFLPFPSFSCIRAHERKKYFRIKKAFFRFL